MKLRLSLLILLSTLTVAHAAVSDDLAEARRLRQAHAFAKAEALLTPVLQQAPVPAEAHHLHACLLLDGMYGQKLEKEDAEKIVAQAKEHFEAAYRLEPKNPSYLRDYAYSTITGIFSLRKGRKMLEEVAVLAPDDPEIFLGLNHLYSFPLVGDQKKAEAYWNRFAELDPARAGLLKLEDLLYGKKDYTAARELAKQLDRDFPNQAFGAFALARVQTELKEDLPGVVLRLKAALELPFPPNHRESPFGPFFNATPSYVWEHIGKAEAAQGHHAEARLAFAKAIELDPSNHWARKGLDALP